MTTDAPRIGLIHALEESVIPARGAFREEWPEARIFDLMDTSLSVDHAERGALDAEMTGRFLTLGRYASGTRGRGDTAAGILFTCSAFGPAIEAVKGELSIPVFKPNEAAFDEAVALGGRIAVLVSFRPSLPPLLAELAEAGKQKGKPVEAFGIIADGALEALKAGRPEEHDARVVAAAVAAERADTIILGQFSLARAKDAVAKATGTRVITTPHAAVRALKRAIAAKAAG